MSGREQGGATLVVLGALVVFVAVIVWALWPFLANALDLTRLLPR